MYSIVPKGSFFMCSFIFLYGTFGASALGVSPLFVATPRPPLSCLHKGDTFINHINWYHKRINSLYQDSLLKKKGVTFKKKNILRRSVGYPLLSGVFRKGMVLCRSAYPSGASLASCIFILEANPSILRVFHLLLPNWIYTQQYWAIFQPIQIRFFVLFDNTKWLGQYSPTFGLFLTI